MRQDHRRGYRVIGAKVKRSSISRARRAGGLAVVRSAAIATAGLIPFVSRGFLQTANAAILSWDPLQTASTFAGGGGSGTWDNTSTLWFNGTTDQTWSNVATDTSAFGGPGGTVTFANNGNAISSGILTIKSSNYVFTNAGRITLDSNGLSVDPAVTNQSSGFNLQTSLAARIRPRNNPTWTNADLLNFNNTFVTQFNGNLILNNSSPTAVLLLPFYSATARISDNMSASLSSSTGASVQINNLYASCGGFTVTGDSIPLQTTSASVGSLTWNSNGTLTINGNNYLFSNSQVNGGQAGLRVSNGTVVLGDDNCLGASTSSNSFVGSNTALFMSGGTVIASAPRTIQNIVKLNQAAAGTLGGVNSLTFTGSMVIQGASNATLTIANTAPTTIADTIYINSNVSTTTMFYGVTTGAGTATISGNILDNNGTGGAGTINSIGPGTLYLTSPSSTYSGLTRVSGGTLAFSTIANAGSPSSVGVGTSLNILTAGAALRYTGPNGSTDRVIASSNGNNYFFDVSTPTTTLTLNGTGGFSGLNKSGSGTLVLGAGTNDSANVQVTAGVLDDEVTAGRMTTSLTINGGTFLEGSTNTSNTDLIHFNTNVTVNNGALDLNGHALEEIIGLNGSGGIVTNRAAATASQLQVGANAGTFTYAGALQDGAGTLSLLKKQNIGSFNIQILTGTSSYSGGTSITGGTLDIVGALTNSKVITVNSSTQQAALILDSAAALPSTAAVTGQFTGTVGFVPSITVNAGINITSLVNSGTSSFNSGSSTVGGIDGTGSLTVTGGARLTAGHLNHAGVSVGPASTVSIAFDTQAHTGGTPVGTSVVTNLSVDPTGTLDLTNNGVVILNTALLGNVASLVTQAYDSAGPNHWDMPGITSSTAAGDPPTSTSAGHAVGYGLASAIASTFTSFNGITFADAVIARYTLVGDHSLKGGVDLSDYTIVIQNLGLGGKSWTDGNFDYSGNVNLSDYTAVIKNIGRGDGQGVFTATGPSAQQVKASSLTLHTAPAVTQASTATDVTLLVNPTNGRVTLINALQTGQAVITAYTINSSSGSLVTFSQDSNGKYLATAIENNPGVFYQSSNGGTFNRWTGIKNVTTFIGEGFSQNYNANNDSTWTNYTMAAGGYALGGLFKRLSSGGVRDLVFQWNDANQSTFTSVVNYVGASVSTPEPGSVSLIAMGAMALLGRRRRSRSVK